MLCWIGKQKREGLERGRRMTKWRGDEAVIFRVNKNNKSRRLGNAWCMVCIKERDSCASEEHGGTKKKEGRMVEITSTKELKPSPLFQLPRLFHWQNCTKNLVTSKSLWVSYSGTRYPSPQSPNSPCSCSHSVFLSLSLSLCRLASLSNVGTFLTTFFSLFLPALDPRQKMQVCGFF